MNSLMIDFFLAAANTQCQVFYGNEHFSTWDIVEKFEGDTVFFKRGTLFLRNLKFEKIEIVGPETRIYAGDMFFKI